LWQLLAGRPPFPTGDPLGKLAAHQLRPIPEICDFAPDTPPPLAEALRALTQRDPQQRPATFAEVTARFGPPQPAGERRLARFRRQFDSAAPLERESAARESRVSMTAVLLLLFVLSGTALALCDTGARTQLLRVCSGASSLLSSISFRRPEAPRELTGGTRPAAVRSAAGLQPLPAPNAEGVIVLNGGPYEAAAVSFVGDLTIRGGGQSLPVIVVHDRPLRVVCRKFTLQHVAIRRETPGTGSSAALVAVRSQEVLVERCRFDGDQQVPRAANRTNATSDRLAALTWETVDARDPDAGHIRLLNTLFFNDGAAVACGSSPGRLEIDNCLKVGGTFFDLREWPAARGVALSARHATLRRAETLCSAHMRKAAGRKSSFRAALEECVFDLAGPQAGLLRLSSDAAPSSRDLSLIVSGGGSVIRPGVPLVAWTKPGVTGRSTTELANAVVEGLAVGEFEFVGRSVLTVRDSAVERRSLQIPRQSDLPPGIVAENLAGVAPSKQPPARLAREHGHQQPLAN
jgi:hypothetical protein